jgi:CRP/FNR family cyclic AMP-dependent transcriptional regulator
MDKPDLLLGIPDDAVEEITGLGSLVTLSKGDVLFDLGDFADKLYVLRAGGVALSLPMTVRGTPRDILVEERAPGQAIGWSALVPPHRFTLKATASIDSEVLTLPRDPLLEYLGEHPETGYTLTRNVATVVGHRLQVLQAMWLREVQRVVDLKHASEAASSA